MDLIAVINELKPCSEAATNNKSSFHHVASLRRKMYCWLAGWLVQRISVYKTLFKGTFGLRILSQKSLLHKRATSCSHIYHAS
jgi:hypothetical protein